MPTIVAYDDRESALPGIEILARSLAREAPSLRLLMFTPMADAAAARLADLTDVEVVPTTDLKGSGWNVKPTILMRALERAPRVAWLDTDIVVTGDLVGLLARYPAEEFVVGQEFRYAGGFGNRIRTDALRLRHGRDLPWAVNSGSIIAARSHRLLLARWLELLNNDAYRAAQRVPARERPPGLVSDQEVLWGLLASDEFLDVEVGYIRTGRDMIQHCGANGYHLAERLGAAFRPRPAFVHMLGAYKPWQFDAVPDRASRRDDYLNMVAYELSPYHKGCQPYRRQLGDPAWLRRQTWPGRILHVLGLGRPTLSGLPLSFAAWAAEKLARR